eukprot:3769448-Rhodomonas_salina.2
MEDSQGGCNPDKSRYRALCCFVASPAGAPLGDKRGAVVASSSEGSEPALALPPALVRLDRIVLVCDKSARCACFSRANCPDKRR